MHGLTLTGAALIAVTYGLARFALGLFAPEFRTTFGLSATGMGLVMSASFVGYLAGLALAGRAIARWGARTVAVGAGVLAATGMAGVAVAPHGVALALAAGIGGTSTGFASPSLAAAVEGQLARRLRPTAQTAVNAGTSLGLMLAVPIALAMATSWRRAWLAFAVTAVAVTLAAARAVEGRRVEVVGPGQGRRASGLSWRLRVTAVLLGLSSAAFWGFGRELLEASSGLSTTSSRSAWFIVGLGGLAGAAAGWFATRVGLRVALFSVWTVFAAAHAVLASGPRTVPGALALAGLFGAGYMALTGLLIVWSVWEVPEDPGAAVAAAFLLLAAGQTIGSPLIGAVVDRLGLPSAFLLAAGTAAAAVGSLAPGNVGTPSDGSAAELTGGRVSYPVPKVIRGRRHPKRDGTEDACTRPTTICGRCSSCSTARTSRRGSICVRSRSMRRGSTPAGCATS